MPLLCFDGVGYSERQSAAATPGSADAGEGVTHQHVDYA